MSDVELKFPVVAHQRLIVEAAKRDDAATKAAFAGFDLVGVRGRKVHRVRAVGAAEGPGGDGAV